MKQAKDDKTICDNCRYYQQQLSGTSETCHANKYESQVIPWLTEEYIDNRLCGKANIGAQPMKTIVKAREDKFGIPNRNGLITADWLNNLGNDSEHYTPTHTIGRVRQNWLRKSNTIELA